MGRPVIELDGVGKRYRLGEHHGSGTDLQETIGRVAGRLLRRPTPVTRDLWSLRDVTLTVGEGEALGIVGSNGAGKSTLLKIVSNITAPTEGRCRTRGRIGSLLEVGTGFHGELTGLENTFLNGAILGMSRREVARRLDEIVAFAGLEGFMDTPVKRYSSGMYLRLGFAIAAHLDADILVVDEVLAVGDAAFQRQCLGKMSEVEQSGRTVLFVSHNAEALARLCPTAMWLDHGAVRLVGKSEDVIDAYATATAGESALAISDAVDPTALAQATAVSLVDERGVPRSVLHSWSPAAVEIDLVVNEAVPGLDVGVLIATGQGVRLMDEALSDSGEADPCEPGRYRLRCPLPPILTPGQYTVSVWLGTAYETIAHLENALSFSIEGDDGGRPPRLIKLGTPWSVDRRDGRG